jgi:ribonuclease P protein component
VIISLFFEIAGTKFFTLQTFKKEERLSEKKVIKELFERGCSFYIAPFKVLWIEADFNDKFPVKILITVSKRNFKNAVDRNRIKRITREAYRKNKIILYEKFESSTTKIAFMLMYTGKIIIPYKEIEDIIILILQRLAKENEKTLR